MRLAPQAGSLWWVDTTILPFGDPEPQRLVVVVDVPPTEDGTIVVVSRSSADGFSRRHGVQGRLWTTANAVPAGLAAPGELAAVRQRFLP